MYLIGVKDYHQSAFAIIDVEAEVRSHARLRVHHLQMKEDKKQKCEHRQGSKQTNYLVARCQQTCTEELLLWPEGRASAA